MPNRRVVVDNDDQSWSQGYAAFGHFWRPEDSLADSGWCQKVGKPTGAH
jgi:hypothetical protein